MKKFFRFLPIVLTLLLFTSCSMVNLPVDDVNTLPDDDPAVSRPADQAPQGIWNNVLNFEFMDIEDLPDNVKEWAQTTSQTTEKVADRMDDGDYTYILVGLGQQPSAGYSVEIVSIEDPEAGEYTVTVKAMSPEPDSMNAAVITYPAAVVRVDKTNINFVFVNEDGTSFIE